MMPTDGWRDGLTSVSAFALTTASGSLVEDGSGTPIPDIAGKADSETEEGAGSFRELLGIGDSDEVLSLTLTSCRETSAESSILI